jgi:hypothetical protein
MRNGLQRRILCNAAGLVESVEILLKPLKDIVTRLEGENALVEEGAVPA